MAKRQRVLIEWLKPGSLVRHGRGHKRMPGDQDLVDYDDIKGSIGAKKCALIGPVADVPKVVHVHAVDSVHTDKD